MKMKTMIPTLLLLATVVSACATNPATGRREVILISEQQEAQMGRQAHEQTIRQFAIYNEKPELNQMVDRVGQRIAAVSDRPELDWTFTILDSPMLNAMALPGGYIYITRGMLERINTEDELAGILGHEIAHVTARHAAQRISQAQLAQIGLTIGAIAVGPEAAQAYGGLAELGATLLFQRYSRQQESQSDLLGAAYMAEAGYNPLGAAEMLRTLDRLQREQTTSVDRYFQSHPDPARRVRDVMSQAEEIRQVNPQILARPMDRGPYVSRLEGIITGKSTMNVTVRDNTIYEKRHGIVLPYPQGYTAIAGMGGLFQVVPDDNLTASSISVEAVPRELIQSRNIQASLRQQLQNMGLRHVDAYQARTATGQTLPVDLWAGQTRAGTVAVETTHFVSQNEVIVVMEISPTVRRGQSPLANTLQVMRIDPAAARRAVPPRLQVGQATASDTWTNLAQRATGNPRDANELALINGFEPGAPVPTGLIVKLPQQVIDRD
jgi:predicted Zn-dependent protease